MNFLNPLFLLGLLAVVIPLVIHFINLRRPKKVAFSSLTFLNKLKQSTIRRIRIKEYLLMALRVAAIMLLAAALARPFLPPTLTGGASSGQPRVMALLIDNSSSTSRIAPGGPLIDQAKEVARRIVNEASAADRFFVATTNGDVLQSELVGKKRAEELIGEIEPVPAGNYTFERYRYLREAVQQSGFRSSVMHIISDGQQSQFQQIEEFTREGEGAALPVQFIKLQQSSQQNTAIGSITLNNQIIAKGGPVTLQVEVKNMSETEAVNQFVSLTAGGRMAGQYEVALQPKQSKSFLFEVNPGTEGDIIGKITLEGDEVPFDNKRHFVVRIPETQSALLVEVDEAAVGSRDFQSYLKPALQAAGAANTQLQLTVQTPEQLTGGAFADYDVIILDGLDQIPEYWFNDLQQQVQKGKGILFFPSEQGDIENYNRFLGLLNAGSFRGINGEYASFKAITKVDELSAGHPVLSGLFKRKDDEPITVDRPALFFYYQYRSGDNGGGATILATETGKPLLSEHAFGEGKVLVSAIGADPGWSNFPVNPLFAPLFYRSALYAASGEQGKMAVHVLGEPFEWQGALQNRPVVLLLNGEEVKPQVNVTPEGVRLRYAGREWRPGLLRINPEDENYAVAVNQHIMESEVGTLDKEKLAVLFANAGANIRMIEAGENASASINRQLQTANFGKEIWNWFLWAAFVILITEIIVSKLYKAESI